jgi:dienelactone hydrolase
MTRLATTLAALLLALAAPLAGMLAKMGYAVFAADLFGKGMRPTEVKDKRQHTGELYQNRDKMRAMMNAALTVELEQAGVQHEMITYSGAPHAFTVFGSSRYREDADRGSWARFGEFLGARLR